MRANTVQWLTFVIILVVIVATVVVLNQFLGSREEASGDCDAPEERHPYEDRCSSPHEVKHVFLAGASNGTEAVQFLSRDGHAWLDVDMDGSGRFDLILTDGNQSVVHAQTYPLPALQELDFVGREGVWQLRVMFHEADGSGRVVAWG